MKQQGLTKTYGAVSLCEIIASYMDSKAEFITIIFLCLRSKTFLTKNDVILT